jgi:hypothetical protein
VPGGGGPQTGNAGNAGLTGPQILVNGTAPGTTLSVAPGQSVFISGTGFMPGSVVKIFFLSVPIQIAETTADSSGSFGLNVQVPTGATLGPHEILAEGVDAHGKPVTLVFPVTVVAAQGAAAPSTHKHSSMSTAEYGGIGAGIAILLVLGAYLVLRSRRSSQPLGI